MKIQQHLFKQKVNKKLLSLQLSASLVFPTTDRSAYFCLAQFFYNRCNSPICPRVVADKSVSFMQTMDLPQSALDQSNY